MSGKKLTKGQERLRQVFAVRVITALAQILYERTPKILAKKTNKRKRILVKTVQSFVRDNQNIRDRIYDLTENHDKEATVQILAQDPQLLQETVGELFELSPGPTVTPSATPSATPSEVPPATRTGLPALERVDDQGLEEGEIIDSNFSSVASSEVSIVGAQPLLGLNFAPNTPENITETQVEASLFRDERLREMNERKARAQLERQGPQGDPTTDIQREAEIGTPSHTSGSSVEESSSSQGSSMGSASTSSGSSMSESSASSNDVGSQPRGLGLRPDQIERAIRHIKNPQQKQVARELLRRGNINFNTIAEELSTAALTQLLFSMLSPGLRVIFLPIIRGAIPQLRRVLGADFNRYFTGPNLVPNTGAFVNVQWAAGSRDIDLQNINLLLTLRNRLREDIESNVIGQQALDYFNQVVNQRYFILASAVPRNEYGNYDPNGIVDPEILERATQFQRSETAFIEIANNILARRLTLEQMNKAFAAALYDYDQAYNNENGQNLIHYPFEGDRARQNVNLIPLDYLELASRVRTSSNPIELFNEMQDYMILNSPDDNLTGHLLRDLRETVNGHITSMAHMQGTKQVKKVDNNLYGDQIPQRRKTINLEKTKQALWQSLVLGAAGGGLGAFATSLYYGYSLQDMARLIGMEGIKGVGAGFASWLALKGLEYIKDIPLRPLYSAALSGAAGLATGVQAAITATPIPIPPDTLEIVQQEGSKGKGTLRPKFILPSTSILDKTENEYQADLDEWAMFDFVLPTSEGAEGNSNTNPLKRCNLIENSLNLQGGGTTIDVPLGEEDLPSNSELKVLALGPALPPMKFDDAFIDDNPFEQTPTYAGYPLDIPDYKNPYQSMTKTIQMDEDIRRSVLYGWVP